MSDTSNEFIAHPFAQRDATDSARDSEPFLAFTFRAGGFDTVMQLGVIHALMVSDRRAPDAVAGVSAGALNAAAMAEVLREPRDQQVGRLREFLNAYRDAPREFRMAFLPDTYELEAQEPLESLKLPIHCEDERDEREEAVGAKTGLIRLFNTLFSLRIPISVITRLIHSVLKISAAAEKPWYKRVFIRLLACVEILTLALFNLHRVSPLSWQALMAIPHPWLPKIRAWLRLKQGKSAGHIISLRRRKLNTILIGLSYFIGYGASLLVWMSLCILLMLVPIFFVFRPILRICWRRLKGIWKWWRGHDSLTTGQRFLRRFLCRFDLDREVASAYPIKQFLVRLFDPQYYGALQMDEVIERALSDDERPVQRGKVSRRTLRQYTEGTQGTPSIHVAPVVTTLKEPKLYVPPPDTSVVEALLAATAVVPFFKPVELELARGGLSLCIDAVNVANEPIPALVEYLRSCQDVRVKVTKASSIHIYAVSSIPTTTASLSNGHRSYGGLVDIALRVLELRRFQTAALERKLTKLYTRLLPKRGAFHRVGDKTFLSTHIFPIEPEKPTRVNERLALAKTEEEKDKIIYETVASGCRAALQVLIQPLIRGSRGAPSCMISCRKAMAHIEHPRQALPGSDPEGGPGLAEICSVCRIDVEGEKGSRSFPQTLRILQDKPESSDMEAWPLWPHKDPGGCRQSGSEHESDLPEEPAMPKTFCEVNASKRDPSAGVDPDPSPWTVLLFSGGVFRGVFQVGVLNALVQVGASPRLFAGSSVGTIMAAMAARLFSENYEKRSVRMLEVASTFLALDRLILTDRFADFVRRFTIRAASARFSFYDMDQLFRRYDSGAADQFSADARRVLAGIERLLYVSPFEVLELVKAIRLQQTSDILLLIRRYLQEFLERYHTGQEVLGAEPLAMLIAEHVLKGIEGSADDYYVNPHRAPFDLFKGNMEKEFLIATTTNLTTGRLTTIGQSWLHSTPDNEASLLEALLASSAFPAVFRPRRSSEVFPKDQNGYQYVDGGIMDNLPLDAVVSFLDDAARAKKLERRPAVPHLLLAGSLEPELVPLDKHCLKEVSFLWPLALARAGQLSYNRKADIFTRAQEDFRQLFTDNALRQGRSEHSWEPLDIEVLNVKPKWLCGTFGFHPMLGFRRGKQAASIAHGCASTLLSLHRVENDAYRKAWKIDLRFDEETVEGCVKNGNTMLKLMPRDPQGKKRAEGLCWFRSDGKVCPFSKPQIKSPGKKNGNGSMEQTQEALRMIYELCGKPETHAPH
jgi:predicted acylesterase/phospholipase RssA